MYCSLSPHSYLSPSGLSVGHMLNIRKERQTALAFVSVEGSWLEGLPKSVRTWGLRALVPANESEMDNGGSFIIVSIHNAVLQVVGWVRRVHTPSNFVQSLSTALSWCGGLALRDMCWTMHHTPRISLHTSAKPRLAKSSAGGSNYTQRRRVPRNVVTRRHGNNNGFLTTWRNS